jgi:hypothetical protein
MAIIVGAVLGVAVGWYGGAFVACDWLWPGSNMCGIVALGTVPVGAVAGAIGG